MQHNLMAIDKYVGLLILILPKVINLQSDQALY